MNPRPGIIAAVIIIDILECSDGVITSHVLVTDDEHPSAIKSTCKTPTAAKAVYTRMFQSPSKGYEKPIWKEVNHVRTI
jgi:hypothetical protein